MDGAVGLLAQSGPFLAKGLGYTLALALFGMAAGLALGFGLALMRLSPLKALRLVVLPQAARTAVAPLSNSFISMIKDTSLAATIQVPELFRQAQLITARTFQIFTMYLAVAAIYWVACALLAEGQRRLERRAAWGVAEGRPS